MKKYCAHCERKRQRVYKDAELIEDCGLSIGLSSTDSAQLFSILQGHVTQLENTVRWKWKTGDVVIWDNRATQHYAVNDYGNSKRIVRRITINGDKPISIDGRRSVTKTKVKKIQ